MEDKGMASMSFVAALSISFFGIKWILEKKGYIGDTSNYIALGIAAIIILFVIGFSFGYSIMSDRRAK
jgi:hypothetical protein